MYQIASIFTEMREMTFSIDPYQLAIQKEYERQIYAVVMEMGLEKAVVSLRCIAEGSISLLFSNGGGIIGIGENPSARQAGMGFIDLSAKFLPSAVLTKDFPLPDRGRVIFYFLTFDGVYKVERPKRELERSTSPESELYNAAQAVIAQARRVDEARQQEERPESK